MSKLYTRYSYIPNQSSYPYKTKSLQHEATHQNIDECLAYIGITIHLCDCVCAYVCRHSQICWCVANFHRVPTILSHRDTSVFYPMSCQNINEFHSNINVFCFMASVTRCMSHLLKYLYSILLMNERERKRERVLIYIDQTTKPIESRISPLLLPHRAAVLNFSLIHLRAFCGDFSSFFRITHHFVVLVQFVSSQNVVDYPLIQILLIIAVVADRPKCPQMTDIPYIDCM